MADGSNNFKNSINLEPLSIDPSNPVEGDIFRSDGTSRPAGVWEYKSGAWTQLGSGSGSGGFNYFTNPDAETDASGFTVYANTTAGNTIGSIAAPDDFGGTPNGSFTFTRNTTTPLIGDADFQLSKPAANVQGNGVYFEFTAENAHLTLKNFFRVYTDLSELDDGDLSVWLVSSSDSFVADFNYISANNPSVNVAKQIVKQFQFDASDVDYRLCIHYASTDTTAKNVYFDDFLLAPKDVSSSAVVLDWKDANVTLTNFGTGATSNVKYKRVGDSAHLKGFVTTGTGPYGNLTLTFNDFEIDTAKVPSTFQLTGSAYYDDGGGLAAIHTGVPFINNSTDLRFVGDDGTGVWNGTNPVTTASGDEICIDVILPIEGWSSNAISSEDLGGKSIHTNYGTNTATSYGAGATIIFEDLNYEDNTAYNSSTGVFTVEETGQYLITTAIRFTTAGTSTIAIEVDGTAESYTETPTTSDTLHLAEVFYLTKGQTIEIVNASAAARTVTADARYNKLSINKLASPQTILETETVAARYTSNSGQSVTAGNPVIYEDLDFDTHNAYNSSTGVYTVPVSGIYQINGGFGDTNAQNYKQIEIHKNGSAVTQNYLDTTATTESHFIRISDILNLDKGDTIEIIGVGLNYTLDASSVANTFSIARLK